VGVVVDNVIDTRYIEAFMMARYRLRRETSIEKAIDRAASRVVDGIFFYVVDTLLFRRCTAVHWVVAGWYIFEVVGK